MSVEVEKVKKIQPGWKIRVQDGAVATLGRAVGHFGQQLYYVDYLNDPDSLIPLPYTHVYEGRVSVVVTDRSDGIDVEEVDGPWRGMTTQDHLGPGVEDLTHENPVQSGPVNSIIAHPPGGYAEPETFEEVDETIAVLVPPVSLDVLAAICEEYEQAWVEIDECNIVIKRSKLQ